MNYFLGILISPASPTWVQIALTLLRIGIGILTMFHGLPKLMGGVAGWHDLGVMFMAPLGITFLPTMWGFLGTCTEFFGGILLILGLGMRVANLALIIMMAIATAWHLHHGDPFNVYSFPLSLIVVYASFFIMGGNYFSLDYYIAHKNQLKY